MLWKGERLPDMAGIEKMRHLGRTKRITWKSKATVPVLSGRKGEITQTWFKNWLKFSHSRQKKFFSTPILRVLLKSSINAIKWQYITYNPCQKDAYSFNCQEGSMFQQQISRLPNLRSSIMVSIFYQTIVSRRKRVSSGWLKGKIRKCLNVILWIRTMKDKLQRRYFDRVLSRKEFEVLALSNILDGCKRGQIPNITKPTTYRV